MKTWQIGLVVLALVLVVYVATAQPRAAVAAPPRSSSNDLFTSVGKLIGGAVSSIGSKPSAPSAIPLDAGDRASIKEFESESPDMTDAQRDAAILG